MGIRSTVGTGAGSIVLGIVTSGRVGMAVLSASRLRDIGYNLHTTRHDTSRSTAASGIGGCSRSTKSLSQLLYKSHGNIVSCNVHGISNTQHNKRAFSGEREAGVRSIQARTGCLLDFANTNTTFPDDRTNEDMGDEEAERIRLRLGSGRSLKWFIVKGSNNQTKGLYNQYQSADIR